MSVTNGTVPPRVAGDLAPPSVEARVRIAVDRILDHWTEAGILERREVEAAVRAAVTLDPRPESDVVADNMQAALDATDGHVARAARLIRVGPKTLYLRLNGVSRPGLGLRRPMRESR